MFSYNSPITQRMASIITGFYFRMKIVAQIRQSVGKKQETTPLFIVTSQNTPVKDLLFIRNRSDPAEHFD